MPELTRYIDILALTFSVAYFHALGLFVNLKNRKAPGNRVFASMLFFLGQWALSHLLVVSNTNPLLAIAFWKWTFVPGVFIAACLLYFVLIYPEEKKTPWWIIFLIFFPAFFIGLASPLTDFMVKGVLRLNLNYLYLSEWGYGGLYPIFLFYQTSFVLGGAILAVMKTIRLKGINKRKMAFVATAFLVNGITGLWFAVWLPRLGLVGLFSLGSTSVLFGATLISYAILKYKMFVVTPQVAAEEIVFALSEAILVCDNSGEIQYEGTMPFRLDEDQRRRIVREVIEGGDLVGCRMSVSGIPLNISASLSEETGAIVILFYDMTEIEGEEENEKQLHQSLKERLDKEEKIRMIFTKLSSLSKIDKTLNAAKEIFKKEPEAAMMAFEHLSDITKKTRQMLDGLNKDRAAIEERLLEISRIHKKSSDRELKIIDFKNKIKELKKNR